jgi:hypothetical protein
MELANIDIITQPMVTDKTSAGDGNIEYQKYDGARVEKIKISAAKNI